MIGNSAIRACVVDVQKPCFKSLCKIKTTLSNAQKEKCQCLGVK